jgi:hydroxyacylglutathione hydrolase
MAQPIVHIFPCLQDNYGLLIHDPDSGETACIDTPEAPKILAEAEAKGWKITQIWNTHWHPDHAGGNAAIKAATGCTIVGPKGEEAKIGTLERTLVEGDTVKLGSTTARVLDTPGHTAGHIIYHVPEAKIAFVGDTLFALGCGRLFEGTPQQMWTSLGKLKAMPDDTTIYCLVAYSAEVDKKRAAGKFTVPTTIGKERKANPFMRADDPKLQAAMGHAGDAVATFAEVRERKNRF